MTNTPAVPRDMPFIVIRPRRYPRATIAIIENIRYDTSDMEITPFKKCIINSWPFRPHSINLNTP